MNRLWSLGKLQQVLRLAKSTEVNAKVKRLLTQDGFNLVLHPLTNGHTPEWSVDKFKQLIRRLPSEKFTVIITGTKKERTRLQTLLCQCPQAKDAVGKLTLAEVSIY